MHNQKGFGLIEVMVAMAILGMGMMCAVQLHYSTARNNKKGNIITIVTMAAKENLEKLRAQNIDDLQVGTYDEIAGLMHIQTIITKTNNRFGRAVVLGYWGNKQLVRVETNLNNSWGKGSNIF
jgi:prepilin-type N-terminal cleavage/methylation domain-containing protein